MLVMLSALWLPSQINGVIAIGLALPGGSFAEAYAASLAIGFGGIVVAGIATGFGARVRFRVSMSADAKLVMARR